MNGLYGKNFDTVITTKSDQAALINCHIHVNESNILLLEYKLNSQNLSQICMSVKGGRYIICSGVARKFSVSAHDLVNCL